LFGFDSALFSLSSPDDLDSALPQCLDAYFKQTAQYVSSLHQDLSMADTWQSESQASFDALQTEIMTVRQEQESTEAHLAQITTERDAFKRDLDARRQSRAVGNNELEDLKQRFQGQSEQLLELARAQQEAEGAMEDIKALQADRDALESNVASLQAQLDEVNKKELRTNKLMNDVWKLLPATEARAKLGNNDDLKTLKAAYSQTARLPLGNFALDLANTPKFTPEALAEKVRRQAGVHCSKLTWSRFAD
jgi:chromosome segregation ATPase